MALVTHRTAAKPAARGHCLPLVCPLAHALRGPALAWPCPGVVQGAGKNLPREDFPGGSHTHAKHPEAWARNGSRKGSADTREGKNFSPCRQLTCGTIRTPEI